MGRRPNDPNRPKPRHLGPFQTTDALYAILERLCEVESRRCGIGVPQVQIVHLAIMELARARGVISQDPSVAERSAARSTVTGEIRGDRPEKVESPRPDHSVSDGRPDGSALGLLAQGMRSAQDIQAKNDGISGSYTMELARMGEFTRYLEAIGEAFKDTLQGRAEGWKPGDPLPRTPGMARLEEAIAHAWDSPAFRAGLRGVLMPEGKYREIQPDTANGPESRVGAVGDGQLTTVRPDNPPDPQHPAPTDTGNGPSSGTSESLPREEYRLGPHGYVRTLATDPPDTAPWLVRGPDGKQHWVDVHGAAIASGVPPDTAKPPESRDWDAIARGQIAASRGTAPGTTPAVMVSPDTAKPAKGPCPRCGGRAHFYPIAPDEELDAGCGPPPSCPVCHGTGEAVLEDKCSRITEELKAMAPKSGSYALADKIAASGDWDSVKLHREIDARDRAEDAEVARELKARNLPHIIIGDRPESIPIEPKRKRGRPKKERPDPPPPKRKPGRPRKDARP